MEAKRKELQRTLERAQRLALELKDDLATTSAFQQQVVQASETLTHTLQTNADRTWDILFRGHVLATLKVASNAGWLQHLAKAAAAGVKVDDFAKATASDTSRVARLLRVLAAAEIVQETGPKAFAANELTHFLVQPAFQGGITHAAEEYIKTLARLPDYFIEKGYKEPVSILDGIYTYAHGKPIFHIMQEQPKRAEAFNMFMTENRAGQKSWLDVYPLETLKVKSKDDILLIDVGGGIGLFCMHSLDQQQMVDQVPSDWRDEFGVQAHDFFSAQPASGQGAKGYYLRSVLHDWPDDSCVTIMKHIRDAMEPGYSKMLINDQVLPDTECPFKPAAIDLTMMVCASGKERTKQEWEALVAQVGGLEIDKIWMLDEGSLPDSVIEISRSA